MLLYGKLYPRQSSLLFNSNPKVDLTPWRYSWAVSATLFSCIVALYLLFSPVGLVGGFRGVFWVLLLVLFILNLCFCVWSLNAFESKGNSVYVNN